MAVNGAIGQEAFFLGVSILVGAALCGLYDVLRIFRRIAAHGNFWIGLEDFLYWITCTGVVFLMIYRENDGMARGFAFGGILLGLLLYHLLLSRFFIGINVLILRKTLGAVGKALCVLFGPFLWIAKKVGGFLGKQLKKLQKAVKMGIHKL